MLKVYLGRMMGGVLLALVLLAGPGIAAPLVSTDAQSPTIIRRVETIAGLRALKGSPSIKAVQVMGYATEGDGKGGPVRVWDAASTCIDDDDECIDPTAAGAGRWVHAPAYIDYPSKNPLGYGRNWFDVKVPLVTDFIDNVFSVQNKSSNGTIYGNAAIAFLDAAGTERGAVGYSRNGAIQPGGYYANTLYLEIGNPFTTDGQNTDLRVINTVAAGGPYWGGAAQSYFPIEVISSTGAIKFNNGGGTATIDFAGPTTVKDYLAVGNLGQGAGTIAQSGTTTVHRIREYGYSDSFSLLSNVSNVDLGNIIKEDATKSAWRVAYGHGNGDGAAYDTFKVSRAAPAATSWTDLFTIRPDGRALIGQTSHAAGADGTLAVTAVSGSALTARVNDANYAGIFYNTQSTGDNHLIGFGTDATYTQRGDITYNRGAGLVAYNTTSDYRAKTVKGNVKNALSRVSKLKPRTGRMIGATQDIDFFVAHELAAVVPSAVNGKKDAVDAAGNPVFQTVDKSTLIPLLVAAIQELKDIVDAQAAKIKKLEKNR